ncbi:MAG: TerB family tellurite resistance protein [Chromatiales bacterium]|nr:MAG: TerB family tellurite resistance protein [Chromatiales bacterium]
MIKRLLDQIVAVISAPASPTTDAAARDAAIRMATAVLMVDVARADHVFEDSEFERVLQLVQSHFRLAPEDAAELVSLASDKAEELTSAYEVTSILHQYLDADEEARIVGLLWQVAYADGQLDKYEDSLVLKISDLLHVSRGRVMRLKHDAAQEARQRSS